MSSTVLSREETLGRKVPDRVDLHSSGGAIYMNRQIPLCDIERSDQGYLCSSDLEECPSLLLEGRC